MVRRTLALLVALFAVAALGATPAHAGGPTSVLLSAPPNLAAVGYDDPQYEALQNLTKIAGSRDAGDTQDHASGELVRATWMIHDMSVWRIDLIYPDAPGGPWIATTESLATGTMPEKPTWHRATDGPGLVQLLDSLKLFDGLSYGTGLDSPIRVTPESTPVAAPAAPPAAQAQIDFFTGWRWTIPGFLLGAVVAVAAVRLLPKRRWELIDTE